MSTEYVFAYGMLYTLFIAIIFYSLGVGAGRRNGYHRGRAAGMRIGRERQVGK